MKKLILITLLLLLGCAQENGIFVRDNPQDVHARMRLVTSSAPFTAREGHVSLVFNNRMWVIGGDDGSYWDSELNDVWYTEDGINWVQATAYARFPGGADISCTVFGNRIWLAQARDYQVDIYSSTDGAAWRADTLDIYYHFCSHGETHHQNIVTFNGKLWILGQDCDPGEQMEIRSSSNGLQWTPVSLGQNFPTMHGFTTFLFDSKLWVSNGRFWNTTDGTNWQNVAGSNGLVVRQDFSCTTFQGKLWLIGGTGKSDVWESPDGSTWLCNTEESPLGARSGHTSVEFNGKLWIIGGYKSGAGRMNDVWCIE